MEEERKRKERISKYEKNSRRRIVKGDNSKYWLGKNGYTGGHYSASVIG